MLLSFKYLRVPRTILYAIHSGQCLNFYLSRKPGEFQLTKAQNWICKRKSLSPTKKPLLPSLKRHRTLKLHYYHTHEGITKILPCIIKTKQQSLLQLVLGLHVTNDRAPAHALEAAVLAAEELGHVVRARRLVVTLIIGQRPVSLAALVAAVPVHVVAVQRQSCRISFGPEATRRHAVQLVGHVVASWLGGCVELLADVAHELVGSKAQGATFALALVKFDLIGRSATRAVTVKEVEEAWKVVYTLG